MNTCDDCPHLGSDAMEIGDGDEICYHVCDHESFESEHPDGRDTEHSYGARNMKRPGWCPRTVRIEQPVCHGMGTTEARRKPRTVDRALAAVTMSMFASVFADPITMDFIDREMKNPNFLKGFGL